MRFPMELRTIAQDAGAGEDTVPTAETVSSYLQEFERNYFIEELPGWDAPVRAKSRLRTKPKRYFADPSLVADLFRSDYARFLFLALKMSTVPLITRHRSNN